MAAKIKEAFGTDPKLIPKGGGVFEVVVDDELVYSKLQTGSFPNEEQLINKLVSTHGKKEGEINVS